ncbi:MAG: CHAP domain-containing protein [Bacilli bacterium]|nr:CHAP domain-containing protein [Bacilli bacterium]
MIIILILIFLLFIMLCQYKKNIDYKKINKLLKCIILISIFVMIFNIYNSKKTINFKIQYETQLTYYYTGDSTGTGTYLPGLKSNINQLGDKVKLNENGWYFYTENGIDYLMVATATNACLNVTKSSDPCYKYHLAGKISGIKYRDYKETFVIKINNIEYNAMVIDSCGACMKAKTATNEKIDILSIKGAKNPSGMKAEIVGDDTSNSNNQSNLSSNIIISDITDYNPGTNYTGDIINGYLFNRLKNEKNSYSNVKDDELSEELKSNIDKIITEIYNRVVEGLQYHNSSFINQDSSISGPGLSSADGTGFSERISQPTRTGLGKDFYFSSSNLSYAGGYTGQCTWYAFGRANEILSTVGSNLKWNVASDAGTWYDRNLALGTLGFKSSSDYTKPKVGAIISWKRSGAAGHVAVIEAINSDNTVVISEANVSSVKSNSNPYGWQRKTLTLEQIQTRNKVYKFAGYIYMLD